MFWTEYPRDVVQVSGADATTYLQSQVSNDLRPLQVGDSAWSFLLQPTGRVDVLLRVWRTADDTYVLDTDAGFGVVMVARLNRFKIRVKADIVPLEWRCVAVRGTSDTAGTADPGVERLVAWGEGYDLLGASPLVPVDVPQGDAVLLLEARVQAAWPQMGIEIVPGETIPAETGVIDLAVSFTKGCYPGQELVERMDSRAATAPRSLQRLTLAEASTLQAEGHATITSVAGEMALALVKRSALPH